MKYTGIYILLTVLLLLAACTGKLTEGKVVTVTIEPQRFFAERIAGDKFVVHCVVPSGQSPETYDPTPKQMVQIGQSEAYLQIGYIGFEQVWMQKIRENNPDLKIFDVSKGMQFVKKRKKGSTGTRGMKRMTDIIITMRVVSIRIYGVPSKGQGSLPGIH